ncbi:MAG: hypothetical protein QOI00_813, partial [Chloroflexota bacterium]|nr:hypothetical protein [Chloroflexota bacterium]
MFKKALRCPTMRLSLTLALVAAVAIGVSACGGTTGSPNSGGSATTAASARPTAAADALRVVTTTTVFADIVAAVGGSRTNVHSIIPPGVGP